MPLQLREQLRQMVERSTAIPAAFGFVTLTLISLALPELREWPKLLSQFSNSSDAAVFFKPKIAPFLLICTTIFWYYRYKGAVLNELDQINDAFEEQKAPLFLGGLEGHRLIQFIGYTLVLTYVALILSAPYIWLYCLFAIILHVADLTGSAITMQNLQKMFGRFTTSDTSEAILVDEQREVLRNYYYGNYTLPRIGALLFVTAATLVLSVVVIPGLPASLSYVGYVPYALMITNILIGEAVIQRWRQRRDRALEDIIIRKETLRAQQPLQSG